MKVSIGLCIFLCKVMDGIKRNYLSVSSNSTLNYPGLVTHYIKSM